MGTGEIVAIVSALALVTALLRDRRGEAMTSQAVRDKFDYISDTAWKWPCRSCPCSN